MIVYTKARLIIGLALYTMELLYLVPWFDFCHVKNLKFPIFPQLVELHKIQKICTFCHTFSYLKAGKSMQAVGQKCAIFFGFYTLKKWTLECGPMEGEMAKY